MAHKWATNWHKSFLQTSNFLESIILSHGQTRARNHMTLTMAVLEPVFWRMKPWQEVSSQQAALPSPVHSASEVRVEVGPLQIWTLWLGSRLKILYEPNHRFWVISLKLQRCKYAISSWRRTTCRAIRSLPRSSTAMGKVPNWNRSPCSCSSFGPSRAAEWPGTRTDPTRRDRKHGNHLYDFSGIPSQKWETFGWWLVCGLYILPFIFGIVIIRS